MCPRRFLRRTRGGTNNQVSSLSIFPKAIADSPGLGHSWAVSGTTAWGRSSRLRGGCHALSLGSPGRGRGARLIRGVHGRVTSSSGLAFSGGRRASGGGWGRRTRGGRRGVCSKSRSGASDSGGHEKLIFFRRCREQREEKDEKRAREENLKGNQGNQVGIAVIRPERHPRQKN